ncbi:uncharacterized protein LOC131653371 [Vicia villosa]|uniref:uncharacterized protein LOC131653371 n=1 Tax=Vicia villosa TaxID=3911 RepID=UPI00273C948C|nr:uncharacterized protein LOC131653371 [Vicia villosa]
MPSKRKVLPTTTPDVASDEEDKSPPRTRQGHKKRQKVTTPVGKGKGPGSSKITSSSDKVSSEESPLKATSNALVMESHNSSPATNTAKDDIGTATSDFNSFNAAIDLGNPQDVPQHTSHILSPVLEDAPPLSTINTVSSVEGSHSTDDSPPTRKDANMGEEDQFSGEDNAAVPSTGSEDTVSDKGVVEETSKLIETDLCGNSNFETVVIPETTPLPAPAIPTPSELEQLRQTDPLSFLKTMMNIDSISALASEASPTAQTKSGDKEDTPGLLHQIKENFFETNLVEILSKDSTRCHGLKQLLKKVDLLLVSKEVSDVIVLLGSLIDQLQSNILRQNNVNEQLAAKMASHSSSWKAATEATNKGDALRLERLKNQEEYDECEKNIQSWKQEIKKLEEKIQEAESRQATIQQTNDQEITEVARLGIQHFEAAQKLVPEIEELKKQRALLELRMFSWEAQYSKIKDSLPRDFS